MLQNILRSRFQSSSRFFSNLRYVNLSDSRLGSLIKVGCVFLMTIFSEIRMPYPGPFEPFKDLLY